VNNRTPDRSPPTTKNRFEPSRDCANCEVREGIPTTQGWGYYASRNGSRMLVLDRRLDQRIRINGTVEIVVLEAGDEKVRLGIEGALGSDTHLGG
jgi:hypothetical protein